MKDYLEEGMTDDEALKYAIEYIEQNHGEVKEMWDDPELWLCVQTLKSMLNTYEGLDFELSVTEDSLNMETNNE